MTRQRFIHLFIFLSALLALTGFRIPLFDNNTTDKQNFSTESPKQIALLLPFSGNYANASRAIQQGFLASYYESSFPGKQKPLIRVYDTSKEKDVQRIYQLALSEGADFVVGPLTKEDVLRLSEISSRQAHVPILALNYHPKARVPGKMIQFSLLPETEAVELAQKAWQRGYRRASIIVSDNSVGRRVANTFSQSWQSYGGQVLRVIYAHPQNEQAPAVRDLFGMSHKPKVALTQRPDVDVIIMATDPSQARQLKPLFDFYHAEKIPVFATSSVYAGVPNPSVDHDLNGVIFCDMPWLVKTTPSTMLLLQRHENDPEFNRLFALGVDAYQLTSQLGYLQSGRPYKGATGSLYMVDQNIQRHLVFAKMVQGVPTMWNE